MYVCVLIAFLGLACSSRQINREYRLQTDTVASVEVRASVVSGSMSPVVDVTFRNIASDERILNFDVCPIGFELYASKPVNDGSPLWTDKDAFGCPGAAPELRLAAGEVKTLTPQPIVRRGATGQEGPEPGSYFVAAVIRLIDPRAELRVWASPTRVLIR
jgi:hypothetical protein